MNDVTVTVCGFAGNTPVLSTNKDLDWTMFRVASTRRFVNDKGDWTDGATLWFTVKAWRGSARNVARSVRKGDPVVVTGRLEVEEWTAPGDHQRMNLTINATAVGLDATRGRVDFTRVVHRETVPDGAPGGADALVAAPAGEADPFSVVASDGFPEDDPAGLPGTEGDEGDATDETGEPRTGQRELVTA